MQTYLVPHTNYTQTSAIIKRIRMVDPQTLALGFTPEGHGYAVQLTRPLGKKQRVRLGVSRMS